MKPMSEKHYGLLIRMSFHRAAVGAKLVFAPLVKRGFATEKRKGTYELTPSGKKAATQAIEQNEGKHLVTFGGISIGTEVMIVNSK